MLLFPQQRKVSIKVREWQINNSTAIQYSYDMPSNCTIIHTSDSTRLKPTAGKIDRSLKKHYLSIL